MPLEKNQPDNGGFKEAKIALDLLPAGDPAAELTEEERRVTRSEPEGVTAGMLRRDIIQIAWPALVELVLAQLASMVDLMMVGKLGPWAITSVGLATQPRLIAFMTFVALGTGVTALVARFKGQGDIRRANAVMRQALFIALVLAVILSVAGYFLSGTFIKWMGAEEAATLKGGTDYLSIQFIGLVPMALTFIFTAALRGVGDSRSAMFYNLAANLLNVLFNYMFIYGKFGCPRLEVAGASLATIMGQFVAFVIALCILLSGRRSVHLRFSESFLPQKELMKSLMNIGVPAMGEQVALRFGLLLATRLVSGLGTIAFATHQIGLNVMGLTFVLGQALGYSATTLVGQSLGKCRHDMAEAYSRHTIGLGLIAGCAAALCVALLRREIILLYNDDAQVLALGALIFLFLAATQPFQSSQLIIAGALRGAGDTRTVAAIMLVTTFVLRPALTWLFAYALGWGLLGAWAALFSDQLVRWGLTAAYYRSGRWKLVRV